MRHIVPTLLLISVLPITATRHHRSNLLNSSRRDTNTRRRTKESNTITIGDLAIKVSEKSGTISVNRAKLGKKRTKDSAVKISIASIQELDADGNVVGRGDSVAHSYESFKGIDFDVVVEEEIVPILIEGSGGATPDIVADFPPVMTNDTVPTRSNDDSTDTDTDESGLRQRNLQAPNATTESSGNGSGPIQAAPEDGGARGAKVTVSAALQDDSEILIEMLLISGEGVVGTANERWAVQPGDTKFNLFLRDWDFCNPCENGEVGEFLEVDIEIKGKKTKPSRKEKGVRIPPSKRVKGEKDKMTKPMIEEMAWDLGAGTTLDLSGEVQIDGVNVPMPSTYPKLVTKRQTQVYTFRFPKFNETAFYDPVVSFDEDFDSAATFRLVSQTTAFVGMFLAYILIL